MSYFKYVDLNIFIGTSDMYYRRKLLLSLLEVFNNQLDKLRLQKLLFLVTTQQEKPDYHFVPYKYGCYSFQSNADLMTLTKYNQVQLNDKTWFKTDKESYLFSLKEKDRHVIYNVKKNYGGMQTGTLVEYTYKKFPYFAINSAWAKEKLSEEEYSRVLDAKPSSNEIMLFTIGYEGLSLEEYINKLIVNDIKVLCDVRKNPLSMKYGFSKVQLETACVGVGIEYRHIPEFGINSDKRQSLNSQEDYDRLFATYRAEILPGTIELQNGLLELLKKKERIALTCFEANINQCHRKHLAEAIANLQGFDYKLIHI